MKKALVSIVFVISLLAVLPEVHAVDSQISDLSLNKPIFEIGETINATVSFSVEFDIPSGYGYCTVKLMENQNSSILSQYTWGNLISEYPYVKTWSIALDPEDWEPGDTMQQGVVIAEAFAYDISGGISNWREESFWVKKSTPNVTFQYPTSPFFDNQTVTFVVKFANIHNTSFPVGNHNFTWTIYKNSSQIKTQNTVSNQSGQAVVSFDPIPYGYGVFDIVISGNGSLHYEPVTCLESFCVFNSLFNDTRPPTKLIHQIEYIGNISGPIDAPYTFACEPVLLSASLTDLISSTPLPNQTVEIQVLNNTSQIVNQTSAISNSTGEVSWVWAPPHLGDFYVRFNYFGNGSSHGASQDITPLFSIWARNITLVTISSPPLILNLTGTPAVGLYRILDPLTNVGIRNLSLQIGKASAWCPPQVSNETGFIEYHFAFSPNNTNLLGEDIILEARVTDEQQYPVYGFRQNSSVLTQLPGYHTIKAPTKVDVIPLNGNITHAGATVTLFVNVTTDYNIPLMRDVILRLLWDGVFLKNVDLPLGVGPINCSILQNTTIALHTLSIEVFSPQFIYPSTTEEIFQVKGLTYVGWVGVVDPYYFEFTTLELQIYSSFGDDFGFEWITIYELQGNTTLSIQYRQLNATGALAYSTWADRNKTLLAVYSGNSNYSNTSLCLSITPRKIPITPSVQIENILCLGKEVTLEITIQNQNNNAVANYCVAIIIANAFQGNYTTNDAGTFQVGLIIDLALPLGPTTLDVFGYGDLYYEAVLFHTDVYIAEPITITALDWTQNCDEVIFALTLAPPPPDSFAIKVLEENVELGTWVILTQQFTFTLMLPPGEHHLLFITTGVLPHIGTAVNCSLQVKPAVYVHFDPLQVITPNKSHWLSLDLLDQNGFIVLLGTLTLTILNHENTPIFTLHLNQSRTFLWPETPHGLYTLVFEFVDPLGNYANTTLAMKLSVRLISTYIDYVLVQEHRILTVSGVLLDETNYTLINANITVWLNDAIIASIQTNNKGVFHFEHILTTEKTTLKLSYEGDSDRNRTLITLHLEGLPPSNFSDMMITRLFGVGVFLSSFTASILTTRKWPKKIGEIKVR